MWRLYHDTFMEELDTYAGLVLPNCLDVVTGTLAAPLIRDCAEALMRKYPQVQVTVHAIRNEFFGGNVSVAGLVTSSGSAAAGCRATCLPCPRSWSAMKRASFWMTSRSSSLAGNWAAVPSASRPMAAGAVRRT